MREAWTDERLDDLKDEMRRGFERVDGEFHQLRSEINERFSSVDARFDAMQRTMVIGFASLGGGLLAAVAATVLAVVLG